MDSDTALWSPGEAEEIRGSVIGILDMDAFEVQIILKLNYPGCWENIYNTQPVVLTIPRSNRLLSLNYLAKQRGLSRRTKLRDAYEIVPELFVLTKEEKFGKPETTNLRRTSRRVYDSICKFRRDNRMKFKLEYASNDEFFFDLDKDVKTLASYGDSYLTEESLGRNTYLEGRSRRVKGKGILYKLENIRNDTNYINERSLVLGATIMERIRQHVFRSTGQLRSSCGVGSNKLMAKIAVSAHKPCGVTILPEYGLSRFSKNVNIDSLPGLQSKGGENVIAKASEYFGDEEVVMFDLYNLNRSELMACLQCGPMYGRKISRIVNGDCESPVVEKSMSATISSSKQIYNARSVPLRMRNHLRFNETLYNLSHDLAEKLEDDYSWNSREAKKITAKIKTNNGGNPYSISIERFDIREPLRIFTQLEEKYCLLIANINGNEIIDHAQLTASF